MTNGQESQHVERTNKAQTTAHHATSQRASGTSIDESDAELAASKKRHPSRKSRSKQRGGAGRESTRLVKAAYYFIRREQARKAWFIFAACVALASLPWLSHFPTLRQGAIVLASLAAGAVFLPELNSGLWRLNAKEIRNTIPEHRRRAFYTELISADCPEDEWAQRWAKLMWQRGVIPLLDAAQDNRRIRWDMTYEISVHLNQEYRIGRRTEIMARVETRQDDERVLPATAGSPLWVSIAGNDASLLSEFNEDACLTRELVCLPGLSKAAWASAVRRLCDVSVRIGPRTIVFDKASIFSVSGGDDVRILRWLVPVTDDESDGMPVSCQIETHYPTELREQNFPVLLAGYYCAGRTTVGFRLYHGQGSRPRLRYFDEFLSEGGGNVSTWKPERFDTHDRQSVTYRTPSDSLLWPGSGIYFWWEFAT